MDKIDYSTYTVSELEQAKSSIDKTLFPERFDEICRLLESRIENDQEAELEPNKQPDISSNTKIKINQGFVRTLSVTTIGGAFVGLTAILSGLQNNTNILSLLIFVVFLFVYLYGIFVAVRLIENTTLQTMRENLRFWQIQIPIFMSPIMGYQLSNGLFFNVWISSDSGWNFGGSLGSIFNFSIFQLHQPWALGINFVAVIMTYLIYRKIEKYD